MKPKSATTKRQASKPRKSWPGPLTQAELLKGSLPRLVHLYRQLEASVSRYIDLSEPPDPLDYLVQNQITVPLERALLACAKAIKASKPNSPSQIEMKAALLYDHALNFEGTDNERRAILAEAMLAIPISDSIKSEVIRFPKTKFGEGGELHEVTDGGKVIWRSYTPARELKRRKERQAAADVKAKRKRKAAKA
jgi:hypothetical protein